MCDWAFGPGGQESAPDGSWPSTHDPDDGVFFGDRWHFGHVSAVLVFGRCEDAPARLALRGDLVLNPHAERPLPSTFRFPHLRTYALRTGHGAPRMRWSPPTAEPFEIAPQA